MTNNVNNFQTLLVLAMRKIVYQLVSLLEYILIQKDLTLTYIEKKIERRTKVNGNFLKSVDH